MSSLKRALVFLLPFILVHSTAGLRAQTTPTPTDTFVVIRAGRMFDSEKGVFLPARTIIVKNNLIDSVGENLPVPSGARVIDLSRYTVLPGLIDAHTHLLYLEDPSSSLTMEGIKALTVEGTTLRALRGAARGRTFLNAGITSVRDLGNSGHFGDVALRIAIAEGSVDGPRMYVSGPGLSPVGGQFPGLQSQYRQIAEEEYRIVRGAEDARLAVRENVTYGARVIKIYANNTPNPAYLSMDEMKAIVDEAKLLRVKVAAHATNDIAVRRAVEAGVDSIEHGYEVKDETLALMKQKGVALVPTDIDDFSLKRYVERQRRPGPSPSLTGFLNASRERLRRAVAAGVTIVSGSDNYIDMGMPQGEAARRVLFAYRESGMEPVQILQSATINAGRLIGDQRLGALKAGSFADIIAIEGDPVQDFNAIEKVKFVMKNGKVYVEAK
jgi:imidazolonepropionase-like amidohydrolase